MHAFAANEQAINVANIIYRTDDAKTDKSKAETLKRFFDDITTEAQYRKDKYNTQESVEIMEKTLYNYYNKRQEILDLYDIFGENGSSFYLGSKIQMCKNRIEEAVSNVNRTFVGTQHFLSEMVKLESEKYFLRNLYASFNYNAGF
jgi:hypothetical protein